MAEGAEKSDRAVTSKGMREVDTRTEDETYVYKDSGIRERHRYIPTWLKLVAYALFIWGIYQTITYW